MKTGFIFFLIIAAVAAVSGQSERADGKPLQKTKGAKVIPKEKSKPIRKEFEAIFARQINDYKAQFEAVKRGEKLEPDCAPDFILTRPDGKTLSCAQITSERQAKFERIRAINHLKIEIGNIELEGDRATVFTTQSFSRVLSGNEGREYTVVTEGTVHKEFWVKTEKGWQSRGFEEVRQGKVMVDGQPFSPSLPR